MTANRNSPIKANRARRRRGMTNRHAQAKTETASGTRRVLAMGVVVSTVTLIAAGVVPETATEPGIEQVGRYCAPDGVLVMAQERLTVPVKPPEEVTVMEAALLTVAPGATVMLPLLASAKLG